MRTPTTFTALTLVALGVLTVGALSGCKTVESNAVIDEGKLKSATSFDYTDWRTVVETHVDDKGEANYPALKNARAPLDRFVATIAKVGPKTRPDLFETKDQKLAYYINAYNALTMFNVINRYPEIKTVTESQLDFFVTTKFPLDGDQTSLYDLENKIVRPTFKDARVHFALNCASNGCPVLPNKIFEPDTLQAQLAAETQKFVHEARNVSIDGNKVVLSEIFKWYAEDFAPTPPAWIAAQAEDITIPEGAEISHRPYCWDLNDQTRKGECKPGAGG